jgi:tRNA uridine 5-carboxymethylaminomethyl modification enzyme
MESKYDVIVVGAGHAGCEAAASAANLGCKTLLVTMDMSRTAQMSCNPAMGGVAKGQIVREIDALGGYSGIISDKSAVQFRMLNRSKGPAMWSPRTQNDRYLFNYEWRIQLENIENLHFWQDMVTELIIEGDKVTGVKTSLGVSFSCTQVVLTSGTFMNGLIHIGEKNFGGGRAAESASYGITEQLIGLGFESGRMKTGTPPRVDGRSLDYSKMEEQFGDENPDKFSFSSQSNSLQKQLSCHITYTNPTVHDILREGFDRSPMFNGTIESIGPRYCPSIEDKINRFSERNRHQIFVEPEGWDTIEVYVNGFSTSLPEDIQLKAIRQIEGFENARIFRPGYAIEYDYFPPTQLQHSLETKLIKGLFFAGQINGTTGYEEAAAQGLMAGLNAARNVQEKDAVVLSRDEAYIGVLIDDLITKGTEEPYRMFTSRAEYRILLRQDNADERLTPTGHEIGLISDDRLVKLDKKLKDKESIRRFLRKKSADPVEANEYLISKDSSPLKQKVKLESVLSRPQISYSDLEKISAEFENWNRDNRIDSLTKESVEIEEKYSGYIAKEKENAEKLKRLESLKIPNDFNYKEVVALSAESMEKLNEIRPVTIGQASRVSGVTPADISVLLVKLGR